MANVMLCGPITTAVIDVHILLLELQRVMNWKMQVQIGLAQAFGGFWSWERMNSALLYYLSLQRKAACEICVYIQDFLPFKDALI